jgi:hypothetical protein
VCSELFCLLVAFRNPAFLLCYRGVVALITVFGYMLTDMGPLRPFQAPEIQNQVRKNAICRHFGHLLGLIVKWCFFEESGSGVAKFLAATCQALVTDRMSSERSSAQQNSLKYILAKDMLRKLSCDPRLEP